MEPSDKVKSLVEQVAQDVSVELVETDFFRAGRRQVLRIYIHKPGGVSVDDCADFSHRLSALLDLEDPIPEAFTLEVSSPGLDRPLRTRRDFERVVGKQVRIQLGKGKPLRGTVLSSTDTEVVIGSASGESRIPFTDILSAKIDLQL